MAGVGLRKNTRSRRNCSAVLGCMKPASTEIRLHPVQPRVILDRHGRAAARSME
jgi:hypothetical protein